MLAKQPARQSSAVLLTKLMQSLKKNCLSHRDPPASSKQTSSQRVLLCLSLKSIRREVLLFCRELHPPRNRYFKSKNVFLTLPAYFVYSRVKMSSLS